MSNADFQALECINHCCISALASIVNNKIVILFGGPSHSKMMIEMFKNAGAKDVVGIEPVTHYHGDVSNYNTYLNDELRSPSQSLLNRINEIDHNNQAIIYAGSTTNIRWIGNRIIIGSRLEKWSILEGKQEQTRILSNQVGYNPVFLRIDNLSQSSFIDLCMELYPCVLSGDLTNGIEMGSGQVFIINEKTKHNLKGIYQNLKRSCVGFRIAQFTDGLPITVYGFCNGVESVYCYPPVVGIVGYRKKDGRIIAPGIIAPNILNIELECIYKTVKDTCRKIMGRYEFCGAFGVDGVFDGKNYTIHDFNPRICAGFTFLSNLFEGRVPQNIIDIIIREHSPMSYQVLTYLKRIMSNMNYGNEVIIWNDEGLSNYLTSESKKQSPRWNQLFFQIALNGNIPLFNSKLLMQ